MAIYRLTKSNSILRHTWRNFCKREKHLSFDVAEKIKLSLALLQEAVLKRDRVLADSYARDVEAIAKIHLRKPLFTQIKESTIALFVALGIAVVIRMTAFELFEIPSGSMRPTYKEQDRLIVSKSQFSLNIPLSTKHLGFDDNLIKRMGVVVFTGQNMDIPNVKTRYFYLFPGYRQYIKRMIGKPGDTLYFYGGHIYGIDKNGNDISNDLQKAELSNLEHIPFIHIEGKTQATRTTSQNIFSPVTLRQMNIPITKLSLSQKKEVNHEMLIQPAFNKAYPEKPFDYYDFWGMDNFANARIIPKRLLEKTNALVANSLKADYYLELTHHPSVKKATYSHDLYYRQRPTIHTDKSYIPLSDEKMKTIWNNIYTGRFHVKNGYMYRFGVSKEEASKTNYLPKLKGVPDGTYEFYQGKLSKVLPQAITVDAASDHPLATYDPMRTFIFFNAGIECDTRFIPQTQDFSLPSARYAYFRDGSLYLMGAPIFTSEDPELKSYVEQEIRRTTISSTYAPFIDKGPPLKSDGSLDIDFIKAFGLKVPAKNYLVLGDNHAMSGDSRDFGFVPEDNIRGTPSFMFWAPGGRFGFPNHGIYPIITAPRIVVWTLLLCSFAIYRRHTRSYPRRMKRELLGLLVP